ncbi:uroporphyrinogen-III synthase [Alcanivorax sp. JB21]|uniref:uroporphyrinogen-III synthase n=1 Tax=Alcanivorax limicola TaxID=2874102 RepID=UPI001CBBC597|nr:uroporphyrinogen-III synthase [Alcanivorax limicola]MBZ2190323.1 uroporphyrinogen-III synthase [Alcanivorax limicola]
MKRVLKRVLVTRPAGQAQHMMTLLQQAGFAPVHQPALIIRALPLAPADKRHLFDLDLFHAVFFVSPNAARLGVAAMADLWPQWPVGVHFLAVGEATAGVLREAGLEAEAPAAGFNSEAVLSLPCLQSLSEKRVLILRGEGGRELFAETLADRGAAVSTVALYRRECADEVCWPEPPVDAVLVTSVESWHCLQQQAARHLKQAPVIVAGSARIGDEIRAAGYDNLLVAASPHDEDMLACLIHKTG